MDKIVLHDGTEIKYTKIFDNRDARTVLAINKVIAGTPNVAIPSHIEGFPVGEILRFAIHDDEILNVLTLPDTLNRIHAYAISDNDELRTVVIKSNNCDIENGSIDAGLLDSLPVIKCKAGSTTYNWLMRYDMYKNAVRPFGQTPLKNIIHPDDK